MVPAADLEKPPEKVFYLPMHSVRKESSTTTKVRAAFDGSAKSSTGVSLNDTLMVGSTIHPSLVDVLLWFRMHRIALVADISCMYHAVMLNDSDRDYHRFVWQNHPSDPIRDYRMTRVPFGVAASSFAANTSVKQNAVNLSSLFPHAATVVDQSLYVDDCLCGADSIKEATSLQSELQDMFERGGFVLRKWNSNSPLVLEHIPTDLKDAKCLLLIPSPTEYTKTLGVERCAAMDHFRLSVSALPPPENLTKRSLIAGSKDQCLIERSSQTIGYKVDISSCTTRQPSCNQQASQVMCYNKTKMRRW